MGPGGCGDGLGYEQLQHQPSGSHMADIAQYHKEMKDGVDIGHTLETIQYGASDVGYAFAHYPQYDGESAGVVEGLEGYEDGESHKHIADGLKVTLCLHLAETHRGAHDGTEPHEGKDEDAPHGLASQTYTDKGKRCVTAGDVPVDGGVVKLTCLRLGVLMHRRDSVVYYRSKV